MKFKYKAYGNSLRPVIPVTLLYKKAHVDHEVLIDSGSDHCFFDAEIGEDIGISRSNSETKRQYRFLWDRRPERLFRQVHH